MGKLILFILLGWLAYLLLRGGKRSSAATPNAASPAEAMTECAVCRLYVPRSESLQGDGKFYCCEEHRRLDRD